MTTATREARARARDRRAGQDPDGAYSHTRGTCGGYASLCGDCGDDAVAEYRAWALANVTTPPRAHESLHVWWGRVGGRFGDAWYQVASETATRLSGEKASV